MGVGGREERERGEWGGRREKERGERNTRRRKVKTKESEIEE